MNINLVLVILNVSILACMMGLFAVQVLKTDTIAITPNVSAVFNPTFSPNNAFSPVNNPVLNATVTSFLNYANVTVTPSGSVAWTTQNVTIMFQTLNTTNNITNSVAFNATSLRCNILFYVNGSNSTPC